jgi:hypothetical protein
VLPKLTKSQRKRIPAKLQAKLLHVSKPHRWFTHTARTSATFGAGKHLHVTPGQTYLIQARDHDTRGNASGWSTVATAAVPLDQTSATKTESWRTVRSPHAWLGSFTQTSQDQARLTFRVVGSGVRLLVGECPTCGSFDVYTGAQFGGKFVGSFGTRADKTHWRQQRFQLTWPSIGSHVVRIVARLEPGQQLRVDGLVVLRQQPKRSGDAEPGELIPLAHGRQQIA